MGLIELVGWLNAPQLAMHRKMILKGYAVGEIVETHDRVLTCYTRNGGDRYILAYGRSGDVQVFELKAKGRPIRVADKLRIKL